jgi:hypothetical protein
VSQPSEQKDPRIRALRFRVDFSYFFLDMDLAFTIQAVFRFEPHIIGIIIGCITWGYGLWLIRNDVITATMLEADPKGAKRFITVAYALMPVYAAISLIWLTGYQKSLAATALPLFVVLALFSPAFRGTVDTTVEQLLKLDLPKTKLRL